MSESLRIFSSIQVNGVRRHQDDPAVALTPAGLEEATPSASPRNPNNALFVSKVQPRGGIYETEGEIFTIAKCRTRKSGSGPMIFYLADLFEDDSNIGVQIWEKSVGVDGELRETDFLGISTRIPDANE
jgi:hypothetical protein